VVTPVAIQRGSRRILSAILARVEKMVKGWKSLHLAVLHADDLPRAKMLLNMAKEAFNNEDIYLCELTPVMGVHIGPGLIGLGYYFE
jgi:fatty acid-binding protein DegV